MSSILSSIHPRKLNFTLSLTYAKKTTRSLLIALDSEQIEEQELTGLPENGDL